MRLWRARLITGSLLLPWLLQPSAVLAGVVSSFTAAPTTHALGASASWRFRFVTPTGVDAPSDSIRFSFPSGYVLAGLVVPGDFDLAVDNDGACDGPFADKTVAAAAAAGTWGVSVSGSAIVFTAPTDAAGGEIAAGRCVDVEVGTLAGGSGAVTNPGVAGVATLTLSGAFGDVGYAAVAAVNPGQVAVNATLPAPAVLPGGGGGGGGPGSGSLDSTVPVISAIQILNNTSGITATVAWETNEMATSVVDYGQTPALEIGTKTVSGYDSSHAVPLIDLTVNTTYYYRIRSVDTVGNAAQTEVLTFATPNVPDIYAPVISDIAVTQLAATSANVGWRTNEAASTVLRWGTVPSMGNEIAVPGMTTTHFVPLSGLLPLTRYYYAVVSVDAAGNEAVSDVRSFLTLDGVAPPPPTDFAPVGVLTGVDLSWRNPVGVQDFSGVRLVYRTDTYPANPLDGTVLYESSGEIAEHIPLDAGETVFYAIYSVDADGNYSVPVLGQAVVPSVRSVRVRARLEKVSPRAVRTGFTGALSVRPARSLLELRSEVFGITGVEGVRSDVLLAPGSGDFAFKGEGQLRTVLREATVAPTGEVLLDFTRGGTVLLKSGDIFKNPLLGMRADNLVNSLDLSQLLRSVDTGAFVEDLNLDGVVNALDTSILIANLDVRGDE